jgi:DNA-binding NarL/FixJ family response regulator
LQAGATGYAEKGNESETLFNGLETMLKGDYFLGNSVLPEAFVGQVESSHNNKNENDLCIAHLTPREQEVMCLMAEGVPRKEIAERLIISPKTVENHAWKIMKKLSLNNTYELVRHAAKLGLIDVDLWKSEAVSC